MKTLLALCALLVLALPASADSTIRIVPTPKWRITPPVCEFNVNGPIQNLSPAGTISGTLKLVLYISPSKFPSPGAVPVAEYSLGQLEGQFQIDKVKAKTAANVPNVTGTYYFTVAVVEYTISGWRTRAYVDTGRRKLKNGVLVTGKKWIVPTDTVLPPPSKLIKGTTFTFRTRATELLDEIAPPSQAETGTMILRGKNCRYSSEVGSIKAKFAYKPGRARIRGNRVDIGKLNVDFREATGSANQTESNFVLYFVSLDAGYYKRTDLAGTGRRVTWGTFGMNGASPARRLPRPTFRTGKPRVVGSTLVDAGEFVTVMEPETPDATDPVGGSLSSGASVAMVIPELTVPLLAPGSVTGTLSFSNPDLAVDWLASPNLGLDATERTIAEIAALFEDPSEAPPAENAGAEE